MARGRLHILLGAAPGVGKTYAMLEEGRRLLQDGKDVVIAIVETHGRTATAAMTEGLAMVPRCTVVHRDVELTDMDLDAVLARHPEVALVDELAHTNAPGLRHAKRWEDVEELLDAGIDVLSTVNIQHIESLNDVVEEITGVTQRETIPDAVVRAADQVEVIDLTPQALRERLSAGHVYPAERIDAALSNYFRVGNLTALRELALLWLADEVDTALQTYRTEHGIADPWEARERVVVALTGGPEGETLLRRGARIAARSGGGEVLGVHVVSQDGLRTSNPTVLAKQRDLIERLGGSYHQVVGDDVAHSLVEFAKAVNATQLVLGATRRHWFLAPLSHPDIGGAVIRESETIDVHIVNTAASAKPFTLPRGTGSLTRRRQLAGLVMALMGGPLLTWLLYLTRSEESLTTEVLAFQMLSVVVALIGGLWPALLSAVMSGLVINYLFVDPLLTLTIGNPSAIGTLGLYVVVSALVSFLVDRGARQTRETRRAAVETEVLAAVAGSVLRGQDAVQAILDRIREAFSFTAVRFVQGGTVLAESGSATGVWTNHYPVGARASLDVDGRDLAASERVRTALLAALSHDLRRPLAAATAAVSGLQTMDEALSPADRAELLSTAQESLASLTQLCSDLLDVSKLHAGVLVIARIPVELADVIMPALDEAGLAPGAVELDLGQAVAPALADPVLLQRVVVNLLLNAVRYAPAGTKVRVATSAFANTVECRITDHGPGVAPERLSEIFMPFQRQGDIDNTTGLGLGLALSKGFVEGMGGTLTPEDTPGGGLTMVITLPSAAADPANALVNRPPVPGMLTLPRPNGTAGTSAEAARLGTTGAEPGP
jgi:two-component system sensor histidine kinase KdpD